MPVVSAFLEGVVADQVGRHLAGQAEHRESLSMSASVRPVTALVAPGTRGHQHDADLAGRAGIALGRVDRALLVADQDVAQGVLLEQRVIDRQDGAARIAEHHVDPLVDFKAFRITMAEPVSSLVVPLSSIPSKKGPRRGPDLLRKRVTCSPSLWCGAGRRNLLVLHLGARSIANSSNNR